MTVRPRPCPFCGHPTSKHGRGMGIGGAFGQIVSKNCQTCGVWCPLRQSTIRMLYADPTTLGRLAENDGRWNRKAVERAEQALLAASKTE